ncbi:MAG: GIY-YIG nuclease family protein [Mycoplasmataceae bacterium]|nr:GIY-YIG nuclease family protein [Mycoplasmataceae bacterium]
MFFWKKIANNLNKAKSCKIEFEFSSKNCIHHSLKAKFWGHHPTRNQLCIFSTLNFTGNLKKSFEDKSIFGNLKIIFYEPNIYDWEKIFKKINLYPKWFLIEKNDFERKVIQKECDNDVLKINKLKNFKKSFLKQKILPIIFCILLSFLYIPVKNFYRENKKKKIDYWELKLKDDTSLLNNLTILIHSLQEQRNKIINDNDIIKTEKIGLDFLEYRYFIENCKYNGKAMYIIWFKNNMKYYVGQTRELIKRQKQHIDWKTGMTKNAKFPTTNIDDIMIAYVPSDSLDEINKLEKEFIEKTGSNINGYNSTGGNKN